MIKYYKYFAIVILQFLIAGCKENCKTNTQEIKPSQLVLISSKEKGYSYCKTLKKAIDGDINSIRKFSVYDFNSSDGYDHGDVLIKLIFTIGEDKYINSIRNLSSQEKKKIASYISIGTQYSDNLLPEKVYKYCLSEL